MDDQIPSRRQLHFLALHSSGKTYAQIALEVYLSEAMVKYELDTLRQRLGACNLYQAQVLALARGFVEVDGREGCLFVPEREIVAA